jgi:PPOX class probable F420-dependent enzyme
MSEDERRAFLGAGTRTAKVAVTRGDGMPHVVPVWFVLDGDIVVFTTGEKTVKGRALQRDSRVSICVDDERPPFAFVMIEGLATVSRDQDELLTWATRIGARYMGADRAEEFGRRNAVPEELLVRVTPTRIVAIGGMAD